MTKTLKKEKIDNIIDDSEDVYMALLDLYKEVLAPIQWDDIENLKPWEVQINRTTGEYILEKMHAKFTKDDAWTVNSLILNKGFSCNHEEVKDWRVKITKECYTLKNK